MSSTTTPTLFISVDPEVLERHPRLRISGLTIEGVSLKEVEEKLSPYLQALKSQFDPDHPRYQQEINRWRTAYGQMGIKPSKYHCSLESLYRRMSKGRFPFGIHPLVDSYNAVSLRHGLCMGAYDLDKVSTDIQLRFSREGEQMKPIGSSEPISPPPESVVYTSGSQIICLLWNYRDADATKIDAHTQRAIFFIDEVEQEGKRHLEALYELEQLIRTSESRVSQPFVLDANSPTTEIRFTQIKEV